VEKTNFSAFFDEGAQNKAEEKEEWGATDIDVIRHPCKSVWKPFESVCILLYFFITAWYNKHRRSGNPCIFRDSRFFVTIVLLVQRSTACNVHHAEPLFHQFHGGF
jgi:hypothetical protein